MKFTLPITFLASALLVKARWQATPGLTWDYLLGASDSVIKASDKQVVTIDLDEASKYASYFHNRGQKVICYFSGGTMQKDRTWDYQAYKNAGVGIPGTESPWGNQYIDIRKKSKLQPLIRKRMQRARDLGCDGVEVDSLGVYGHNVAGITKDDCYVFAKWVAETGHDVGISVGLKNIPAIAPQLVDIFDFAVVESCAEYNECKHYTGFTDRNKAVFMVHYESRGHKLSGSSLSNLIEKQGGHRFTCVLSKNKNLDHNCTNYDCNTGAIRGSGSSGSSGQKSKNTTSKKTTTTYKKKTTTTTIKRTTTTKKIPTQSPVYEKTKKTTTTKTILTQKAIYESARTTSKKIPTQKYESARTTSKRITTKTITTKTPIYINTKTIPKSVYINTSAPKSPNLGTKTVPGPAPFATSVPPKSTPLNTVPPKSASYGNILPPKSAQFNTLPPKTASFDTLPPKTTGFDTLPPKTAGFDTLPPKTAGFDTFPPKTAGFDTLPPKTAGFDTLPPKTAGFDTLPPKTAPYGVTVPPKSAPYDTKTIAKPFIPEEIVNTKTLPVSESLPTPSVEALPQVTPIIPPKVETPKGEDKEVKEDKDNSSSVGTTVAVVGGVATAAVAGLFFLKRNKKISKDSFRV